MPYYIELYKTLISIHALREESDEDKSDAFIEFLEFQSTLSVRRATRCLMFVQRSTLYFNPRSP